MSPWKFCLGHVTEEDEQIIGQRRMNRSWDREGLWGGVPSTGCRGLSLKAARFYVNSLDGPEQAPQLLWASVCPSIT